jgi:hypothetical protein
MNRDDFEVPAMMDVPPDAYQRIEARVLADQARDSRSKLWLAAAAAIVLVAGGVAMVTTQSSEPAPPAGQMLPGSPDPLDRCWEALQRTSRDDVVPDRALWQPVATASEPMSTVTAIKAGDKRFFCETTKSHVTVSDPDATPGYVSGAKTGSLLLTDNAVAGFVDPSWPEVVVEVTAKNKAGYSGNAKVKDGMFVFVSVLTADGTVTVGPGGHGQMVALPEPPPPLAWSDLGLPRGDRTSERGKLLGQCITEAGESVDSKSWGPGAMVEAGGERLIMATNPLGAGACFQQRDNAQFMPDMTTLPKNAPTVLGIAPTVGGKRLVAGVVPAAAVRTQLTLGDNTVVDADTANSTFAALVPADTDVTSCKVFGPDNQVIYTGPLASS